MDPRASQLWSDTSMITDGDDLENDGLLTNSSQDAVDIQDGRTPLDRTIDRIGMGSYQWTLLSLCGFGWLADNMWLQAVAIILPRIQAHYGVSDAFIGTVSSSMFGGMMIGAVGWGTCSDLMGRSTAFNATLFFTAVFGILASFSNSFFSLCVLLFFLGTAIGGSMPTDGTLLLEHMPKEKQYLVTALSVFFSFGSVLSALVALVVLPGKSCSNTLTSPCDVNTQNQGWKYLLITLGIITLTMFLARMVFFRLHESPRYLVHAGRPQDAVRSLQMISKFNGNNISIELEDVRDIPTPHASSSRPLRARADSRTVFDANDYEPSSLEGSPTRGSSSLDNTTADGNTNGNGNANGNGTTRTSLTTQYASTGETLSSEPHSEQDAIHPALSSAAAKEASSHSFTVSSSSLSEGNDTADYHPPRRHTPISRRPSYASSYYTSNAGLYERWIQRPLSAWWDRVLMVLSPEWVRTTILVWTVWFAMSLAYTMFNVFLPKLLETRGRGGGDQEKTLDESLWDVVIFTLGGTPGALLGAYLVESSLGRRWSLAGSTLITAFCCFIFAVVESRWAVRLSTISISLSATSESNPKLAQLFDGMILRGIARFQKWLRTGQGQTMWAVLYGWTPEIFGTKVRGTACGIASALSRIGGMIAPMLGGILLTLDRAIPVYTSVVIFAMAGFCVLLLSENEAGRRRRSGKAVLH